MRSKRTLVIVPLAVAATLQKHGCQLVAVPQLTPDGQLVAVAQ